MKLVAILAAFAAALWLACAGPASAHKLDSGFLEIRELGPGAWSVVFKVPQAAGRPLHIRAVLPENCTPRASGKLSPTGTAFVARWIAGCTGGISGQKITVEGLASTRTDVLLRVEAVDGSSRTALLTSEVPTYTVEDRPSLVEVVRTYFRLGVEHILFGIDHLLFILAMILLVRGNMRLIKTVTAFTVAHSITLSAATLGYVHVPGPPVEAAVALSIVFVATELAQRRPDALRFSERYPWIIAFAFGLLHGFGFAGALAETGLPEHEIPAALLTFNLGVEVGQLVFIAAVLILRSLAAMATAAVPHNGRADRLAQICMVYAIGAVSAFWIIDRIAGFTA